MNQKSINPGKIKPLFFLFWLAISSMAVLASCNHTPTASSFPTATTSPSTENITQAAKVIKAEAALKNLYTEQVGLAIESVTCPEDANFQAGSIFECQAIAQGVKFGIEIQVENDEGRFDSKVKGRLLNLSKVEDLLQKAFKDKAKLDVTADCGGKRRVSKAGDIFTCKVTDKQGQVRNAQVTVKDEQGNFNVKIEGL
ncbi:DUF4333 domain-containing protein [Allocoleopsis franciscana]|uniref:DUF4333 domain-containing protein n=1 Tax=Allocoleopsis franciscana PCC 7113 TaxID=1173027 RepID=K9WFD5_9CYAN|nr:DUF4333 domain-containing protein [Allocoleopsis franciscana]AFZ18933.1 hypothetical protein Mic7113_3194 [Allocoleopsis franciscana PCC 7113]